MKVKFVTLILTDHSTYSGATAEEMGCLWNASVSVFCPFFWLIFCAHQARSPKPHLTAKHKKTKPTKTQEVSTSFVPGYLRHIKALQNFSSATFHRKTHPEYNKTNSSD